MSATIDYYNRHAQKFSESTKDIDFSAVQNHFLSKLPVQGRILDFGCGSGRDTKHFLELGYSVDAIDGSKEMCLIASEYTGIPVKHMYFEMLHESERYDGIWACSSILHLDRESLADVMIKMMIALKPQGIIYTSFKYGDYEGMRNGRYFIDFTEDSFKELINNLEYGKIIIEDEWITTDARPGRSDEKWLNIILRKTE